MRIALLAFFVIAVLLACKKQAADPSEGKFAARLEDANNLWGSKNLIHALDEQQWTIAYTIAPDCYAEKNPENKVFEAAITRALQLWLEPIKKNSRKC